jgi:hypothetical protein
LQEFSVFPSGNILFTIKYGSIKWVMTYLWLKVPLSSLQHMLVVFNTSWYILVRVGSLLQHTVPKHQWLQKTKVSFYLFTKFHEVPLRTG